MELMKPFDIIGRWQTTVIYLLVIFEILDVLDDTLTEIRDGIVYGGFVKIFMRTFFVFSIG